MHIPRIDHFLLGYRKLVFKDEDKTRALNIFLKNKIGVKFKDNTVYLSVSKYKAAERVLAGMVDYELSEPLGIYGLLLKFVKRPAAFICALVFFVIFLFSSLLVWDVRVEGVDAELSEKIEDELALLGLKAGKAWFSIDKDEAETRLLMDSEHVSWVNINRRGTVAYVSVIEKIVRDEQEKPVGYANIVAERDCIIEEITVESGYASVKVGDTVKAGQVLISGVFPSELGGGLCYAKGRVVGRYSDDVSVSVPRYTDEKIILSKKTESFSIKIFSFPLKVFKRYRNLPEDCVIIEDERHLTVLGGKRVPISFVREISFEYGSNERELGDAEMIEAAQREMQNVLSYTLADRELLKIKTSAEFDGDCYFMTSRIVCRSDVGVAVGFDAEILEK